MSAVKPRVLIVGRTRYRLPLNPSLTRKFDALTDRMELRVLCSGVAGERSDDPKFRLVPPVRPRALDGLSFHLALPVRVARELRRFQPDVVLVQGAHEAAGVLLSRAFARSGARVVVDVHGDWRVATRLYGSPARRLLNGLADKLAVLAVRRADGLRTVSEFTSTLVRELGAEPTAVFPAFVDVERFLDRPPEPLPSRPAVLFVGVLERYKNIDGLAAAWRLAAARVPGAELRIVGTGSRKQVVEKLLRDVPDQTRWLPELSTEEVAAELDRATFLVLPSRREGMGRVILEAFCRGRPVVGARAGGIPDLVRHGENGILVDPDDIEGLADALTRLLSDKALAERLAAGARLAGERRAVGPGEFADSVLELVAAAARPVLKGDSLPTLGDASLR
jgi:glycosyltransferase involved in cell wall biosynthesis